jgi:phage host-nuclease inhibitor protein Gam
MKDITWSDLIDDVDEVQKEIATDFAVTDLQSADWCLRKVESAERNIQRRRDFVTAYRAKLDAWLEKANAADFRTTERMAELLRPWAEKEIAIDGKRKSVSLPTGTVGFRESPDSIEVEDERAAIENLENDGASYLIRIKKEIDKRGLMAAIKAGCPLPTGCNIKVGERRFYIKAGE